jgi:hypothetical protein
MAAIHETPHARRTRELIEAIADWRASTGAEHVRDRHHAMRLLRAERLRRNAERSVVARKAAAHRLRNSAASLRLLASLYDGNADYSTDRREIDAWDGARHFADEAAAALEDGANDLENVWQEEPAHAA